MAGRPSAFRGMGAESHPMLRREMASPRRAGGVLITRAGSAAPKAWSGGAVKAHLGKEVRIRGGQFKGVLLGKDARDRETKSEMAHPALAGDAALVHEMGKGDRVEVAGRRGEGGRDGPVLLCLEGS